MPAAAPHRNVADPSRTTSPTDVELAFVLAPRQNLFFAELVAALAAEVQGSGACASVHTGNFPPPRADLVYVLVSPHEYFTLMHGRRGPSPATLKRTIFVCAEQPGASFFDENVALAPRAGAVFDISRHAVRAFRSHGVPAHHLQLGWTAAWDHLTERERDIDVLFLGCISDRRSAALAEYARTLWYRHTCYVLPDNSRPNWTSSESFRTDTQKWDLLTRSKVLINIHQGESPYFEWLRILQAISNGAVVVSEHSLDHTPLVPGRHFVSGRVDSLGLLTQLLLDDGERRHRIQTDAYRTVRSDLPLRRSVRDLIAMAASVAAEVAVPDSHDPFFHQPPLTGTETSLFAATERPPSPARGDHNAAVLRRAAKDLKLELLDLRRGLARLERAVTDGCPPSNARLVYRTRAYAAIAPQVSVLTALYNYESHVRDALDSLLRSHDHRWELVVVDDGSTDRSGTAVKDWMHAHEDIAAQLVRHPVNRGLGTARNTALAWARGRYCFVLDADNEIYPHCLGRLIHTLETHADAAFAYGMLERFGGGRTLGLMNTLPWEPWRLRMGNYIDAMALVRAEILRDFGGYSTDRRLHGWEDYDLWCRLAEAGMRAAFVPEVVARYRTTAHSMLSITNISATDAFSLLIERCPTLMAGLTPPE